MPCVLDVHIDGGNTRAAAQYPLDVLEAAGLGPEIRSNDRRDPRGMFHLSAPRLDRDSLRPQFERRSLSVLFLPPARALFLAEPSAARSGYPLATRPLHPERACLHSPARSGRYGVGLRP